MCSRKKNESFFFAKNLNKVLTALSKKEDDDGNNKENVSDAGGRRNDTSHDITELTQ